MSTEKIKWGVDMKKKTVLGYILVVLLFVMVSCSTERGNNSEKTEITSIQDIPTSEEISQMSREEIYDIKLMIEGLSIEESENYFKKETENFLMGYENVNLKDLSIIKDNLSIIRGKNNKSLFNLIFKIDITVDNSNMVGSAEYAADILKQLSEFYWEYSYFNLKAKKLYITAYDLNGNKINEREVDMITEQESVFVNQPQDEMYVQTIAYNVSAGMGNFMLQKFGVIAETKELYIEYYLEDNYFTDNYDMEAAKKDLENIAVKLNGNILSDEKAVDFVTSNNVEVITISFNSSNFENSYITFNYPV